jgi:hypothetical protein
MKGRIMKAQGAALGHIVKEVRSPERAESFANSLPVISDFNCNKRDALMRGRFA